MRTDALAGLHARSTSATGRSLGRLLDARSGVALRLVIVDDHTLFRVALKSVLDSIRGVQVIGEAGNGRQAVELAGALLPELVLMDVGLPLMNGVEATSRIKKRWPHIRVLIVTEHVSPDSVFGALHAGASGYVVKSADLDELLLAIEAVATGESYLSPPVSRLVVERQVRGVSLERPVFESLTPREREVLQLVAEGYANRDIASQLCLSVKTVEAHKAHIMQKLHVRGVAELVKVAVKYGLGREDPAGATTTGQTLAVAAAFARAG